MAHNALFGLINVLTRAPSDQLERNIDFSAGPHGLAGFKTTISDSSENQGYRLNFNAHHDGGYRDESGYDQQKLTLRHNFHFNNTDVKTVLSAFNLNQETAGFIKSRSDDEAYKDTSLSTTNPNPEAYRDWKSFRLSSSWTTKLANGDQLTITPYLRDNEMRFLRHFVPEQSIEENSHKSIGAQTAYSINLSGGHKLVMGTDVEFTRGRLEDTQTIADINKFGKYRPQGKHYDYDVDSYSIAPYLHSEWLLTEQTRLIAGLRFEHTQYDYDNKMLSGNSKEGGTACAIASGCLYLRPADRTDTFNNFSPKLGVVHQLNGSNSLYANLSRGFRAPQVSELYQLQNKQTEGDIDSEQIDSFEIGARGLVRGIQYDIALYHMKRKNVFFRDGDGLNVTGGRTKHSGIEIGLNRALSQRVDLAASITYARHKYDFNRAASGIERGNDMDTAPRHQSNVRLGWDFLPNSRTELEWIHIGKYYTDASNAHRYDGHDLVNLRIDQSVTKQLNLYGRITNLTNTKYAERADFAFGSHRFFPGERRALHIGGSLSF
jgi:iron complex outermembrane receptor protein